MELNNRYIRRSPDGDESVIIIKTESELNYHEGLAKEGFTYTQVRVSAPPEDTCASCSA